MFTRSALVCSYYTPHADRDSGSRRLLNLVRLLKDDRWNVSFAATNGLGDTHHQRILRQQGISLYDASKHPLAELVSTFQFDLAIFAFWPTAEYHLPMMRRLSPETRVIVDSIDLNFLRDARRIFYEAQGHGPAGALDSKFAAQMIAEINTYAAADGVLAVSRKEADWINDLVGSTDRAWLVPLSEDRKASDVPRAKRKGIVFVGNFQHSPNVEAVRFLCRSVLPILDARLLADHPVYVVGNAINDTIRSFATGLANVHMVGWVPTLEPYFERTRISVLPLPYGAGIKGKLVQALMTGTPTVSTRIGVEGLDLTDGTHVLVADEPAEFARAMTQLLTDDALWTRLAREGRRHVMQSYSQESEAARFREAVAAVMRKDARPPLLPDISEPDFRERVNYQYRLQLMPHIRIVADQAVPHDATIAVISEGNDDLLKLNGRRAWHFLREDDGRGRPGHPHDSAAAIAQLETLREQGADYLLVPRIADWWLDHYKEFRDYLDAHYPVAGREKDVCVIHDLRRTGNGGRSLVRVSVPTPDTAAGDADPARLIAFYLPQFHPIPENDAWWGEGFTEWTNVAKAQPLFADHHQPHIPADLGFYDLRLADTRRDQAQLARAAGVHGFCYYHYWFNGKMLLDRPFNDVLRSGTPNFPFCLCWANEPWSRRWDGRARDVLQPQSYSAKDDLAHIQWLLPALADRRAITIEGKPAFLVYRAKDLPDPAHTTDVWRREVLKAGLKGLYLIAVETGWDANWDATEVGFDAKVLFQPQFSMLHNDGVSLPVRDQPQLRAYDYARTWPALANPAPVGYRRYLTVTPRWDNTPRQHESGVVLHNSTPEAYEDWLREAITHVQQDPVDHRIVFINAWNEWGEGCHLEPDLKYGRAYLDATRRALDAVRGAAAGDGRVPDAPAMMPASALGVQP